MHRLLLNPTRSARRTLRHVCVATLGIPPEKCGAMMLLLRFHVMQHSIKLAWAHRKGPISALPTSARQSHSTRNDAQYRRSTFKTERALDFASPFSRPLGETDAPAPVRAKEWVWERMKVRDLFYCSSSANQIARNTLSSAWRT